MANFTGTVTNSGGRYANQNILKFLNDELTTDTNWDILRYDDTIEPRELIVKGKGYSGTEEIFIGFRSYQSVGADYYNLSVAAFTGYVSGNTFATQPGYKENSLCGHNLSIQYWISISPQRVAMALKVGTPVYETAYVGKFFPFATPTQYPYPMVCFGTLTGQPATRYSDATHSMSFKGSRTNALMRDVAGSWIQPACWPWNASLIASGTDLQRDTGSTYFLNPILVMKTNTEVYGQLEGVYHISGFNNVVENTLVIDSKDYVVIQDVGRTSFNDYIALEVTP